MKKGGRCNKLMFPFLHAEALRSKPSATIGGGHYGEPKVCSSSVRFESSLFPAMHSPGALRKSTVSARPREEGEAKAEIPQRFKSSLQG